MTNSMTVALPTAATAAPTTDLDLLPAGPTDLDAARNQLRHRGLPD